MQIIDMTVDIQKVIDLLQIMIYKTQQKERERGDETRVKTRILLLLKNGCFMRYTYLICQEDFYIFTPFTTIFLLSLLSNVSVHLPYHQLSVLQS